MTDIGTAVRSPAKINWNLRVIGKRPDGYHEIESLVSTVTWYDQLTFTEGDVSGFELCCDDPDVPMDDRNLVCRAAQFLSQASGHGLQLRCRLIKTIPIGGGLGGGSSNAAATLKTLNDLWGLRWPRERLLPIAAALGSDVPFFLYGRSALIRGRGERIERVSFRWPGWIVLLMPGWAVSTAAVYRAWEPAEQTCTASEPILTMATELMDAVALMKQTFNMLEDPAMKVCPPLGDLLARSAELAGRPVRLSGSGSTVFTAFDTRSEAQLFAERAEQALGLKTRLVQLLESDV